MRTTSAPNRFPRHRHCAALAAVLLAAGCSGEPQTSPGAVLPPPAKPVAVAVAGEGFVQEEEVVGTVRPVLRATVEAKVPGRIEELRVVVGQVVRKGETLAVLDAREIRARLDSATAVREQSAKDLERITRLVRDGAATASELDAVQARQAVAVAVAAEAATLLDQTRIAAPFDGVVTRKLADVGDLATPGRGLFEMEDPARLRFETDLSEALLPRIRPGAAFPVRVGDRVDPVRATVVEVSPVSDPVSRSFRVKFDLPAGEGLRSGQFGRVFVPTGGESVLHVPTTAVLRRGQLEFVQVVADGVVRLRLVRTGRVAGGRVELVAGIRPGERVAAVADGQWADGQSVEGAR
jgi:RND family efflux transporter MFP subunit